MASSKVFTETKRFRTFYKDSMTEAGSIRQHLSGILRVQYGQHASASRKHSLDLQAVQISAFQRVLQFYKRYYKGP